MKKAKKPAAKPKGRPTRFTTRLSATICRRLSTGEPLAVICRDSGMPGRRTVLDWRTKRKDFADDYNNARLDGFDAIAHGCLEIADDIEEDPSSRRVRVDTRLKLLSKWDPSRYGDRLEVEQTGPVKLHVVIGGDA